MRRRTNSIALLVGIGLIIIGVLPFLGLGVALPTTALALAIAAGALLLGLRRNALGTVALAVWLFAQALLLLVTINIPSLATIVSVLAVVAGVLIMLER
jgi:hypothetical protein